MSGATQPALVHVIDDEEDICWAIEALLAACGLPCRSWGSAVDFLEAFPRLAPFGCVLTDIRMPEVDGFELLRRVVAMDGHRPVIVMTAHGDVTTAVRAMKAGAFDFIEKPFEEAVLLSAIRAAIAIEDRGPAVIAPAGPGRPEIAEAVTRIGTLSPREREVLDRVMDGKPGKVIALELGISPRTVEVHRLRLMARLGVGSLAEAVRLAVRAELGMTGGA